MPEVGSPRPSGGAGPAGVAAGERWRKQRGGGRPPAPRAPAPRSPPRLPPPEGATPHRRAPTPRGPRTTGTRGPKTAPPHPPGLTNPMAGSSRPAAGRPAAGRPETTPPHRPRRREVGGRRRPPPNFLRRGRGSPRPVRQRGPVSAALGPLRAALPAPGAARHGGRAYGGTGKRDGGPQRRARPSRGTAHTCCPQRQHPRSPTPPTVRRAPRAEPAGGRGKCLRASPRAPSLPPGSPRKQRAVAQVG